MNRITVQELKKRMDAGEELNLLDVREDAERAEFNIGGTHLPLGMIMSIQTDDIADWQTQEIICYCRSGARSSQAALMLETLGFTNVVNLDGGMNAWKEANP